MAPPDGVDETFILLILLMLIGLGILISLYEFFTLVVRWP